MRDTIAVTRFIFVLPAFVMALSGCHDTGRDDCIGGFYPFVGCWVTQACTPPDDVVGAIDIWEKNLYEFTPGGDLNSKLFIYDNVSCNGTPTDTLDISGFVNISYEVLGPVVTRDGLEGHSVVITISEDSETVSVEGEFVVTADNLLCTSNTINLGAGGLTLSESATGLIDFENCLSEGRLP